ncbi:MAG: hypothetical protein ABI977_19950 [Acidobacteriota bacterium]
MSDPLRVALVAEGPTDGVVIEAALRAILSERPFVLTQIFPEGSISFGTLGAGWIGVYRWCHQSAKRGNGRLHNDALVFQNYDLLILHLDADVAGYKYEDGSIPPKSTDGILPCQAACPPATDTTNALRTVLLSWCGEVVTPERAVLCMPSKSTEAWVVAALFPNDQAVTQGIECYPKPETRLGQQPIAKRIRKKKRDYDTRSKELEVAWPRIATEEMVREAHRFQTEFLAKVPAKSTA